MPDSMWLRLDLLLDFVLWRGICSVEGCVKGERKVERVVGIGGDCEVKMLQNQIYVQYSGTPP